MQKKCHVRILVLTGGQSRCACLPVGDKRRIRRVAIVTSIRMADSEVISALRRIALANSELLSLHHWAYHW